MGPLPSVELTSSLELVYQFVTSEPMGHQIPLLFESPARILIRISSVLGQEKTGFELGN